MYSKAMCNIRDLDENFLENFYGLFEGHLSDDNESFHLALECALLEPRLRWKWSTGLVVCFYAVLLVVGVVGCCATGLRVYLGERKTRLPMSGTMIYITALTGIDLASTSSIAPLIIDELFGVWPLGTTLCRTEMMLQWVGKILNTYMLLAISLERYIGICRPHQRRLLSRQNARRITVVALVLGGVQLVPIFLGSEVVLINHDLLVDGDLEENMAEGLLATVTVVVRQKCEFTGTGLSMNAYMIWLCTTSFALPLATNLALSWRTFRVLRRRMRNRQAGGAAPAGHVYQGWSSLFLTGFYTLCFLPHWATTVLLIVLENWSLVDVAARPTAPLTLFVQSPVVMSLMYVLHGLPYVNSGFNWILYGLMNSRLRTVKYSLVSTRRRPLLLVSRAAEQADRQRRRWLVRRARGEGIQRTTLLGLNISSRLLANACTTPVCSVDDLIWRGGQPRVKTSAVQFAEPAALLRLKISGRVLACSVVDLTLRGHQMTSSRVKTNAGQIAEPPPFRRHSSATVEVPERQPDADTRSNSTPSRCESTDSVWL